MTDRPVATPMRRAARARESRRTRPGDEAETRSAFARGSRQLLHELRVHQIELEMQNEELRRAQEELEASRARYFDLYDLAPVGYFTLSEEGLILEANLTAARLLGVARGALVKQPLTRFILPEDQDIYYLHRKQLFETGAPQVRVADAEAGRRPFWARLEATTAQDGDGAPGVPRRGERHHRAETHEAERLGVEPEIRQVQKTESLGRMAGAIAHHFNNQLAVVIGNLELSMGEPASSGDFLIRAMLATRKAAEVSGLMLTYLGQSPATTRRWICAEVCARACPCCRPPCRSTWYSRPICPCRGRPSTRTRTSCSRC